MLPDRERRVYDYSRAIQEIAAQLEQRLDGLPTYAEAFCRLLARQVVVVGTNRKEKFVAERSADGSTF